MKITGHIMTSVKSIMHGLSGTTHKKEYLKVLSNV